MSLPHPSKPLQVVLLIFWVILLAYFFAEVEIQIEGGAGWAANLPTWRIEKHWLLDLFWGGRSMTGYHAWIFPFIAMFFHYPLFFMEHWSWRAEARIIGCIMLFWIAEDFLWFVVNPAFGIERFNPVEVTWHKRWLWGVPIDYLIFSVTAVLLLWLSYKRKWRVAAEDRREVQN